MPRPPHEVISDLLKERDALARDLAEARKDRPSIAAWLIGESQRLDAAAPRESDQTAYTWTAAQASAARSFSAQITRGDDKAGV